MNDIAQIKAIFFKLKSDFKGLVSTDGGKKVFIKYMVNPPMGFFEAEVNSYKLLEAVIPNNIPAILYYSENGIATEFISAKSDSDRDPIKLATLLVKIHKTKLPGFGAKWLGFIGPLEMDNTHEADYRDFFYINRIEPYLKVAYDKGLLSLDLKEQIISAAEDFKGSNRPMTEPCLVHGDLWSGNIIFSDEPYLIDPACHGANRELDLAMIKLFGIKNQNQFFKHYNDLYPPEDGYEKRVLINQLFYLLVHIILFGKGYVNSIEQILESYFRL